MSDIQWYDADNLPNHNDAVWGWCPDLKNDDEPDGMVIPVRYTLEHQSMVGSPAWNAGYRASWVDLRGRPVKVKKWAFMDVPDVPASQTDCKQSTGAKECLACKGSEFMQATCGKCGGTGIVSFA